MTNWGAIFARVYSSVTCIGPEKAGQQKKIHLCRQVATFRVRAPWKPNPSSGCGKRSCQVGPVREPPQPN